ncbi:hypothetical protein IT157_02845 [bacterium]|nr:hypothetical protein [bacterium]
MKLSLVIAVLLVIASVVRPAIVFESESNNDFALADVIQCGDTVQCAGLDAMGSGDFYRFALPPGDSTYLTTFACGASCNTFICLYDASFNLLSADDNGGVGEFSRIGYFCQTASDYYAQVFRAGGGDGSYSLSLDCISREVGDHDLCSSARDVSFLPYYDEGTTTGALSEAGTAAGDVFYHFSRPYQGNVLVQICSEFFDSRVQLLTHCVGGFGDDSDMGTCQLGADLTLFALQEGDYFLLVEGTSAPQMGDYSIEVSFAVPPCPTVAGLVLGRVGGLPFLDWPTYSEADYYFVEQSTNVDGPFEGLAISYDSYYTDSTGFLQQKRFYQVRAICQ